MWTLHVLTAQDDLLPFLFTGNLNFSLILMTKNEHKKSRRRGGHRTADIALS